MRTFFLKLGFRKMDEMEKDIALKAQRIALIYALLALAIWSFYESFKVYTQQYTSLNLAPSFLLVTTSLVLIISQLVLQKRVVKGDDEYKDTTPIIKIIGVGIIVVAIIISIGAWIVFSGT